MFAVWSLPCATHDKAFAVNKMGFAVSSWHTANFLSAVVLPWDIFDISDHLALLDSQSNSNKHPDCN